MKIVIKQNYLIFSGTLLMALIICVLRFYPIVLQRMELNKEMKNQQISSTHIKTECSRLPVLRKQVREMEPVVARFDELLPGGQQYATLFQQIAEVMDECELVEQNVQPGKEITADGLGCIPLTIKCKGTFNQVYQFLARLEGFERVVRIENLQLSNDSKYEGVVTMDATASVYFQTLKQEKA